MKLNSIVHDNRNGNNGERQAGRQLCGIHETKTPLDGNETTERQQQQAKHDI
jgi:hypothetical protein